jgi:glycosyltransferase involved in cell wall biosynthesis
MKHSILLVNQHTLPIFADIVNAFARSGFDTRLFTGFIEPGSEKLDSSVRLIHSIKYNRKSTVSRLFTWNSFTIHYFFYLLFCKKPSFIVVVTNPPFGPIVTAWIAHLRKIPYHIVIYDLYPEAIFQAGMVDNRNMIFKIWQRLNRSVFHKASLIFTLSDSMRQAAMRYVSADKIKVIYNWVYTSYIFPVPKEKNTFLKKHSLENKFVILYSGNMGLTHDLESLIEAADLLKHEPDVVFVLIGDGGKRAKLQQLARSNGLTNTLFLPYQETNEFPMAMAAADIGVVTLGIGAEGISVPSKTYINLAAGLCLLTIAPKNSELNRLVEHYNAGVTCEPGNGVEVSKKIKYLISNQDVLAQYKKNAVQAVLDFLPSNAFKYVEETKNRMSNNPSR